MCLRHCMSRSSRGRMEIPERSASIVAGYLSVGSYVDRIEQMLAAYTGAGRAVAVVNGRAALFIGLKLAGVEPGDEVLIPALTFVATANAVTYCGATPHFVDSEDATLGMDPVKLGRYLNEIADSDNGRRETASRGRESAPSFRCIRLATPSIWTRWWNFAAGGD